MKSQFNAFYGWYMIRYTNGKSTPILTNIVDAISVGSFFTPFLSQSTAGQGLVLNAVLGFLIVSMTVIVASVIVAFVGHLKIRYGTLDAETRASDMQRPLVRETWENSKKILEELKVEK